MPNHPSDQAALQAALRAVIDRWDPEGLLALGTPHDEYEPEAADLARRRARGAPITSALLVEVWEHWFGPRSGFVSCASPTELAAFADELESTAAPFALH